MNDHQNTKTIQPCDQKILETYGILTALNLVNKSDRNAAKITILINDIMAYVNGETNQKTALVQKALTEDLTIRRQYMQLVKQNELEHIAKPRAAHSNEIFEKRVGDQGVVLKLKQSKGNASQYYLIVEFPASMDSNSGKSIVLHANTDRQTQRAVFPPLHDGRTQIILDKAEPLFRLLQDHDVEIYFQ